MNDGDLIEVHNGITRNEAGGLVHRLSNKHSIERIAVMERQRFCRQGMCSGCDLPSPEK